MNRDPWRTVGRLRKLMAWVYDRWGVAETTGDLDKHRFWRTCWWRCRNELVRRGLPRRET